MVIGFKKEDCEFKPIQLCLKTHLLLYPAGVEGLGKHVQAEVPSSWPDEKDF